MSRTRSQLLLFSLSFFAGSAPITGFSQAVFPLKLNEPLLPSSEVTAFQISPDGSKALYLADQLVAGKIELFSVPMRGGTSQRLNDDLVTNGEVLEFKPTPDGSMVVYLADQDINGQNELYSVSIEGGVVRKLNDALIANGDVNQFQISPDGTQVVYRATQDTLAVFELYSVPITGGAVVKLSGTLAPNGDVSQNGFKINADSSRVVYLADQDVDNEVELYSVPIGGGAITPLNGPLVSGGDVLSFELSSDGSRVVYLADEDMDGIEELFSVPITGGPATKLNGVLTAGGQVELNFQISPDGNRVIYRADQETDGTIEIFSVPVTGGATTKLNGTLPASAGVDPWFQISRDSKRVVYRADQDSVTIEELYSVPIGGGPTTQLNSDLLGTKDVDEFEIAADSSTVVYVASQDSGGVFELYSVPITGGTPTKLNGPLVSGGDVGDGNIFVLEEAFAISADSTQVLYLADQETDGTRELYSVPIAGGTARKLNAPLFPGGEISEFSINPAGGPSAYLADQDTDEITELYAANLQSVWVASGGNWSETSSWRDGLLPGTGVEAVLTVPALARILSSEGPARADFLSLGGGNGLSIVELQDGASLTLAQGAELLAGAVVRGDGIIALGDHALTVPAGAEVRAGAGERLLLQSGNLSNAGRVEALGTGFLPAEVEISNAVTNEASTGAIIGHHAVIRVPEGMLNKGAVSFGSGLNDFFGDLGNTGLVIVSGGATAVFWDDVVNNATINVSSAGGVQSIAVFFGALSGNGVGGTGAVFLEGDTRPGFSPGTMAFGGDVSYGHFANLEVEIGGIVPGTEYDQVTVTGHLALNGSLHVTFINGFVPSAGMAFDLWEAGSVSGEFSSVDLPALPAGLFWHTNELNTSGEVRIGLTPENYPSFRIFYSLATSPVGDGDADGFSNLLEYITAGNPVLNDTRGKGPQLVRVGAENHFRFVIAEPLGSDVVLEVQTSTTLQDSAIGGWEVIATRTANGSWSGNAPVLTSPAGDGLVEITVRHALAEEARRFYRLAVQLVP